MTTTVTVKANHGWPVRVEGRDTRSGAKIEAYQHHVEAGETREFICHSSMDLHIHEIQPDEMAEPTAA